MIFVYTSKQINSIWRKVLSWCKRCILSFVRSVYSSVRLASNVTLVFVFVQPGYNFFYPCVFPVQSTWLRAGSLSVVPPDLHFCTHTQHKCLLLFSDPPEKSRRPVLSIWFCIVVPLFSPLAFLFGIKCSHEVWFCKWLNFTKNTFHIIHLPTAYSSFLTTPPLIYERIKVTDISHKSYF